MPKDKYSNFEELFKREIEGVDYRIVIQNKNTDTLIMAPHGGKIEPGTSEIAHAIAGKDKSLYAFEGLKSRPHSDLHVTSHRYNEPHAVEIATKCSNIVAVHGRGDNADPVTVWIGGRDIETGQNILKELRSAGFECERQSGKLAGTDAQNICNRGKEQKGVQLEIARSLRRELTSDVLCMEKFSMAVRTALSNSI
jgi:phage replication-related protein YjqB (UPF0714/DUF867 family)